jgi:hypothetical protein
MLTAAPPANALVGQHASLGAQADCAGATLEYRFTATDAQNVIHTIRDYASAGQVDWSTAGLAPGSYQVAVSARVAGGAPFATSSVAYELTDTSSLASGLVLHLADGDGTDSSGIGGNLSAQNGGASPAMDRYGRANKASFYAGTGSYQGTPTGLPSGSAPRTLSAWVRTNGTGAQTIFGQASVSGQCGPSELDVRLAALTFGATSCNVFAYDTTSTVVADQWTLVSVTFDGSKLVFYVNGTQVDSLSTFNVSPGPTFYLGVRYINGLDHYTGYLDDVRVYDRVLTPAELANLALVDL